MSDRFRRLPSLNALRAFEASGRHLSFRAAAEELNVTQGAVAQHVRALEAELGVALFQRLPRRLALTDEGKAYLPDIRRAFELMAEATGQLRPAPTTLTISVTPSFAAKWLIPRLPDFVADNPLIDLRVLASESLASFQGDGVDVAVRQGQPPFGPGLTAELLFPQQIIAVCSPGLPAASLQEQVLLHDTHNLWPEFLERAVGAKPATATRRMRFNQTGLAIDAAIAGQGVALASRFLVEADLASGRLVQPVEAELRGVQDFYLVAPRKPRNPAPTEAVRRWLLGQRVPVSV